MLINYTFLIWTVINTTKDVLPRNIDTRTIQKLTRSDSSSATKYIKDMSANGPSINPTTGMLITCWLFMFHVDYKIKVRIYII